MGCDIHTRVEYKHRNGNWLDGNLYCINRYYDPNEPYCADPYSVVEVCSGRNYELFATLANVRNYSNIPYIQNPRGIPDDACARTVRDHNEWDCDAHSASYFTLKELMNWRADAPSKVKRSGMVSPESAAKLDATGEEPSMWCAATGDKTWVYREWEVEYNPLDHLIDELIRRGKDLWLWFDWTSREDVEKEADKLRFVFWFDN